MAQQVQVFQKCPQCGGTGTYTPSDQNGAGTSIPCPWPGCDGDGEILIGTVHLDPGLDEIDAKIDAVIAEQASQRNDLTAILTQIWNKVKDL